MSLPEWFPDWREQIVVLVAAGPGAKGVPLELARGVAKVGVINRSWELAPWADVMYAADYRFWESVSGCPKFPGLKVTCDERAARNWKLHYIHCNRKDDRVMAGEPGTVGGGGNGGFQLYDAVLSCWGLPRAILLVGYDATLEHGIHWHGKHVWRSPNGCQRLGNPQQSNVHKWRNVMDNAAKRVSEAGVRVINCSPVSALKAYPKMAFAEALDSVLCKA